mgnify:CR=1 FL=1
MNQTENDRMIALMEHAVEHLAEHAEITLQDCEQILSDGKQNKNDMYLGFAHYYSGEAYYTLNNVEKVLYHISHAIGYLERANAWELVARQYFSDCMLRCKVTGTDWRIARILNYGR